ncbi:hypothetical protein [Sanguibacter sp. HDW7]|uniref:hypothetical protein n=1 Tax=Sanguibacter sp. HDW7 TaxID=2714931 RepID=UPI00140844F8|nr:hypothetical protein [Sanguibacter sp. HDW7]QIK83017.1 hypothetical protein G7063_04780 [Sanguibacter sp. HDW7]
MSTRRNPYEPPLLALVPAGPRHHAGPHTREQRTAELVARARANGRHVDPLRGRHHHVGAGLRVRALIHERATHVQSVRAITGGEPA